MGKGLEIAADSKKSAGGIETILVVEDEEALKVVSRRILELRIIQYLKPVRVHRPLSRAKTTLEPFIRPEKPI